LKDAAVIPVEAVGSSTEAYEEIQVAVVVVVGPGVGLGSGTGEDLGLHQLQGYARIRSRV
jgi:hypothetical protein